MNKTVTINISGIIFHIEEDAFEKLSKYLSKIKGYFSKTDGGNEIMSDIEARIAEMLQGKINAVKQVVLMADVDSVIESMGKPEEFAEGAMEEETTEENNNQNPQTEPTKKRMFRDPDNKAVGGVCSGIAAYFDVDVVWIRLAMVLLVFFGGVSASLYIILWIVIPEAKTTAEKLAMRGEKIDINNISKTVKEEAELLKKRMEKHGVDLSNGSKMFKSESRNFFDKLGDFLKEFFALFGKVFGRLIGLFFLCIGLSILIPFVFGIFGFSIAGSHGEFGDFIDLSFNESSHYAWSIVGLIIAIGIPVFALIYLGIKLLFKITYSNRWLNLGLGLTWLAGLAICAVIGFSTVKDIEEQGKVKEQIPVTTTHDTLYLELTQTKDLLAKLNIEEDEFFDEDRHGKMRINLGRDGYLIAHKNNSKILVGRASFDVVPSHNGKVELEVIKTCRGETRRSAIDRAKLIKYNLSVKDSVILFDEIFSVEPNQKLRAQDVDVILRIPAGKVIKLHKNMEYFIYDIGNVTNTYDGDMVDRRWKMTNDGLECVDCEGLGKRKRHKVSYDESDEDFENFEDPNSPETPKEPLAPGDVNVKSKDAHVKIDKDGININAKEADVKINKDGIHIDTEKGTKKEK